MDRITEADFVDRYDDVPEPQDDVVIVRWKGHEIVYSLTEPNADVSSFEDKVPAWAKAMGILHALRVILEVQELQSILSIACVRMRELHRLKKMTGVLDEPPLTIKGEPNRG